MRSTYIMWLQARMDIDDPQFCYDWHKLILLNSSVYSCFSYDENLTNKLQQFIVGVLGWAELYPNQIFINIKKVYTQYLKPNITTLLSYPELML